ncbi:MAG: DUF167 domain-containing protein [Rhodobacteraceae bacterium]|nr:DUF167 domain-containing protein [Paracoccaceae bacterium]
MKNAIPDLGHLARPGAEITLRATPKVASNGIELRHGALRATTTAAAENGKANAAIGKMPARALGLPKSRLTLIRGAPSRDKTFRIG